MLKPLFQFPVLAPIVYRSQYSKPDSSCIEASVFNRIVRVLTQWRIQDFEIRVNDIYVNICHGIVDIYYPLVHVWCWNLFKVQCLGIRLVL